uniref:High mobility group 20B n=1 Tax=Equus asinus TaxID=9793 RepID=A0A9L0KAD6_EQUAS
MPGCGRLCPAEPQGQWLACHQALGPAGSVTSMHWAGRPAPCLLCYPQPPGPPASTAATLGSQGCAPGHQVTRGEAGDGHTDGRTRGVALDSLTVTQTDRVILGGHPDRQTGQTERGGAGQSGPTQRGFRVPRGQTDGQREGALEGKVNRWRGLCRPRADGQRAHGQTGRSPRVGRREPRRRTHRPGARPCGARSARSGRRRGRPRSPRAACRARRPPGRAAAGGRRRASCRRAPSAGRAAGAAGSGHVPRPQAARHGRRAGGRQGSGPAWGLCGGCQARARRGPAGRREGVARGGACEEARLAQGQEAEEDPAKRAQGTCHGLRALPERAPRADPHAPPGPALPRDHQDAGRRVEQAAAGGEAAVPGRGRAGEAAVHEGAAGVPAVRSLQDVHGEDPGEEDQERGLGLRAHEYALEWTQGWGLRQLLHLRRPHFH